MSASLNFTRFASPLSNSSFSHRFAVPVSLSIARQICPHALRACIYRQQKTGGKNVGSKNYCQAREYFHAPRAGGQKTKHETKTATGPEQCTIPREYRLAQRADLRLPLGRVAARNHPTLSIQTPPRAGPRLAAISPGPLARMPASYRLDCALHIGQGAPGNSSALHRSAPHRSDWTAWRFSRAQSATRGEREDRLQIRGQRLAL